MDYDSLLLAKVELENKLFPSFDEVRVKSNNEVGLSSVSNHWDFVLKEVVSFLLVNLYNCEVTPKSLLYSAGYLRTFKRSALDYPTMQKSK